MVALSTFIAGLGSSDTDGQRRKEEDQRRAAQVVRMRADQDTHPGSEPDRRNNDTESARTRVIPYLKRADQHIRNKKLDLARHEVEQAKLIDPANMYVHALEERIASLTAGNGHSLDDHHGTARGATHQTSSVKSVNGNQPVTLLELFHQIDQCLSARDFDRGRKAFEQARQMDPYNLSLQSYQQRLEALQRDIAIAQFKQAAARRAEEGAQRRAEEARHREARETFNPKKQEEVRQSVRDVINWVGCLVSMKSWDQALDEIERGRTIDPGSKDLLALKNRIIDLKDEDLRTRSIEEAKLRNRAAIAHTDGVRTETNGHAPSQTIAPATRSLSDGVDERSQATSWHEPDQERERVSHSEPDGESTYTFERLAELLRIDEGNQPSQSPQQDVAVLEKTAGQHQPAAVRSDRHLEASVPTLQAPAHAQPPQSSAANMKWTRAYRECLRHAWSDGIMSNDERELLSILVQSLGISETDQSKYEQEVQWDLYLGALVRAWLNGAITPADSERLDDLRTTFRISAELHCKLERKVRQEILKRGTDQRELVKEISKMYAPVLRNYDLGDLFQRGNGHVDERRCTGEDAV